MTSSPLDKLLRVGQLKKRNLAQCGSDLDVDKALVAAIIRVVQAVAERVAALGPIALE